MDTLIARALVLTAARVSAGDCSDRRIAELDEALRASDGHWTGMPLAGLPENMATGHFRYVYVADSDVLPLDAFDTARRNGTMAALPPESQRYYLQVERQRARSLARLARDRGVTLSADQLAEYREKVERDRQLFGDCVAEVEPMTLAPVPVVGASGP